MQFAALHSFSALTQRSLEMNFFLFIFKSLLIIFSVNYFHKCSTIKFDSNADVIVKCLRGSVHGVLQKRLAVEEESGIRGSYSWSNWVDPLHFSEEWPHLEPFNSIGLCTPINEGENRKYAYGCVAYVSICVCVIAVAAVGRRFSS